MKTGDVVRIKGHGLKVTVSEVRGDRVSVVFFVQSGDQWVGPFVGDVHASVVEAAE